MPSRSWAPAAYCPAHSRLRRSSIGSSEVRRRSAPCPPTVGWRGGPSTPPDRGRGTPWPIRADSSAISTTTGGGTRCHRSRSRPPIRCSSCCWKQLMPPSPTPAGPRRGSSGRGPASWWARCSVVSLPINCRWGCDCRRRAAFCATRSRDAAWQPPRSTGSSMPTKRRCSSGCRHSWMRRAVSRAARWPAGSRRRSISWGVHWRSTPATAPAFRPSPPPSTCSASGHAMR